jgi:signal transduction histidine kinase
VSGPRRRSLFWTFAGVFLLVLAAATVLQVVVSVAVLRPLAEMSGRERAELAAMRAARALAALPGDADDEALRHALRAGRVEGRPVVLVFYDGAGRLVVEPPMPGGGGRGLLALLGGAPVDSPGIVPAPEAWDGAPRAPRGVMREMPRPPGPGAGPPPGERPGLPGRGGARPPGPGGVRAEVLARRTVLREGAAPGEVAAIGLAGVPGRRWLPEARALLLFLPFAVLAAGGAGLIMARLLARRLRALERLAERVGEGDLDARVEARGLDEVGRLEERFNRMTERLAAVRAELDRAEAQRSRLLADITHELSTPLTSIRGYVETLLDPDVPTTREERAGYLRDVRDEAMRLDLLIQDLFDLVRLEAGASALEPVRLDWAALCRNTARRFEPRFREAGLTLRWTEEPAEAWIRADGRRMEQVVENLLINALRYVPAGGTVTLSLAPAAGSRHRLTIADDGPGIAAEDLPHVFERFYRAAAVRSSGGSGLGLAIVREIVQRHGGEVRAERAEPRGAVFVVELPAPAG